VHHGPGGLADQRSEESKPGLLGLGRGIDGVKDVAANQQDVHAFVTAQVHEEREEHPVLRHA
jgi:hypothetical protein